MGEIEDRLATLGLSLPTPFSPPPGVEFRFDLVRVSGGHAYFSGHGPLDGAEVLARGKVGAEVSPEEAYEAARLTALSVFTSLERTLGDLERVTRWVKLLGLVNCAPGFNAMPGVINGFSDLVLELWGDDGHHARSAIGVAELPFDIPVEVEGIVEIAEVRR
jgi:enamine deaminase RidA (YjgF/YER057c/UK114 family)